MEEVMKNSRTMVVLAGLVVLVGLATVVAQVGAAGTGTDIEVKVKVPMAFYVGDKLLPAGEYEVKQTGGEQANTITVTGKGKNEAVIGVEIVNSNKPVKSTEVTFNKYGNKDYLASIITPGGGGGTVTQTSWVLKVKPSAGEQAAAQAAAATNHSVPATASKKQK
jgi:hypothetical protein